MKASAPPWLLSHIREAVPYNSRHQLRRFSASKPSDYAVVDLSQIDVEIEGENGELTQGKLHLEARQHRRAAIMKMNGLLPSASTGVFTATDLATPSQKLTMWAVEFYDQSWLEQHPVEHTYGGRYWPSGKCNIKITALPTAYRILDILYDAAREGACANYK